MKKIIFTSILIATVLAGGVFAYTRWKAIPLTADGFYNSARQYYDEDPPKYREATIQLLNAVRLEPGHRDARRLLAQTYLAQRDPANAARQLKALLEYDPADTDTELQLGNIYLIGGPDGFREAQKISDEILKKDPANVGALILSGNAQAGLRNYQDSVALFEQALSLDPGNLSAFVSLGTAQALREKLPEAERAFLNARQVDPKNKSALMSLAHFYRATRNSSKAEAIFKEAVGVFPADKEVYLPAVTFYAETRRFQEAEALLKSAQAAAAEDPTPSLILAELLANQERPADVRKLLIDLKQNHPKDIEVAARLALNLLQDQPARAQTEIDQIIEVQPRNPIGYVLQGELQFFSGEYDKAKATLEQSPAIDSQYPQAHYFLGNIALRKGQVDQAISHFQKSLTVQSSYVPSHVALGEVFLNLGKVQDSREQLRKALEIRPDFVPARALKAAIDRNDKNFAEAGRELADLEKKQPESAFIQRQMAMYNESRGRPDEAEKNLFRAQTLHPDSPEVFRELILLNLRSKQPERALKRIDDVPADQKKAFHYELAGLAYAQMGKAEDAEKAFKKALELDPSLVSSDVYLFANYMNAGKVNEGIKKLDDVIDKTPNNAQAYAAKALLLEQQGNIEEAKRIYNEALKLDPGHIGAANNLAWILAEEGTDLNTAVDLAQMARSKDPNNPSIADTLGWVYHKLGNLVLAREQLRFAVSKDPENTAFQYHLGVVYQANKQYAEARAAFEKAAASRTESKERELAREALKKLPR